MDHNGIGHNYTNRYDLQYPVNALRNVALDEARTDVVPPLDVDFYVVMA